MGNGANSSETLAESKGFETTRGAAIDVHPHTSVAAASEDPPASARTVVDADVIGPAVGPTDPVDATLARALALAVEAGRLDLVATIVEELRARRLSASPNVVALPLKAAR